MNISKMPTSYHLEFLNELVSAFESYGVKAIDDDGKLIMPYLLLAELEDKWLRKLKKNLNADPDSSVSEESGEMVDHPAHYNSGKRECIAEMELLFGPEDVAGFCRCSAYKYRTRAGAKPGNPKEQDLAKADWYIDYLDDMIKRYSQNPTPSKIGFSSNKEAAA